MGKGIGNVWGMEWERYVERNMNCMQNGIGYEWEHGTGHVWEMGIGSV